MMRDSAMLARGTIRRAIGHSSSVRTAVAWAVDLAPPRRVPVSGGSPDFSRGRRSFSFGETKRLLLNGLQAGVLVSLSQ